MTYIADAGRYEGKMQYRRTGRSGLGHGDRHATRGARVWAKERF